MEIKQEKQSKLPLILFALISVAIIGAGIYFAVQSGDEQAATTEVSDSEANQVDNTDSTAGENNSDSNEEESEVATDTESDTSVETVEYDIDMSNYDFSPARMEARAGGTLVINLTNSQGTHDLVIDELDIASRVLAPSQSETLVIEIPEDAAGESYQFYCSIGNHRALGMEGVLEIIE